MKYQQVHISRLSRAGEHLDRDGAWHPFEMQERAWYRVAGKIVQRVRLDEGEDVALLDLFADVEPVSPKALKEGFREEVTLAVAGDRYALRGTLLRAFVGWDLLARAARRFDAALSFHGGNALECVILFDSWTSRGIADAIVLSKAFAMVGASLAQDAREGIPHTEGEITGLLRTAHALLREECGLTGEEPREPAVRRQRPRQASLFPGEDERS